MTLAETGHTEFSQCKQLLRPSITTASLWSLIRSELLVSSLRGRHAALSGYHNLNVFIQSQHESNVKSVSLCVVSVLSRIATSIGTSAQVLAPGKFALKLRGGSVRSGQAPATGCSASNNPTYSHTGFNAGARRPRQTPSYRT